MIQAGDRAGDQAGDQARLGGLGAFLPVLPVFAVLACRVGSIASIACAFAVGTGENEEMAGIEKQHASEASGKGAGGIYQCSSSREEETNLSLTL